MVWSSWHGVTECDFSIVLLVKHLLKYENMNEPVHTVLVDIVWKDKTVLNNISIAILSDFSTSKSFFFLIIFMLKMEGMGFYILNLIVTYMRNTQDSRHGQQYKRRRFKLYCYFSEFRAKYLVDICKEKLYVNLPLCYKWYKITVPCLSITPVLMLEIMYFQTWYNS